MRGDTEWNLTFLQCSLEIHGESGIEDRDLTAGI